MSGNNISVDEPKQDISLSLETNIFLGIVLVLTSVFTVIANGITIFIFATDKALKGFSDRLVLNLAVADGLIGTTSMGMRVHLSLTEFKWIYGRTSCLIFLMQESWFNIASIVNTMMISLDHLLSLKLGKESYDEIRGKSISMAMIFGPWVYSFLMFSLPIVVWKPLTGEDDVANDKVCDVPFNANPPMALAYLFLPFLPITAVPVIDVFIFFLVRKIYKREVLEQVIKDEELQEVILGKASLISLQSQKLASEQKTCKHKAATSGEQSQASLSKSASLTHSISSSVDTESYSVASSNLSPNITSVSESEQESNNASKNGDKTTTGEVADYNYNADSSQNKPQSSKSTNLLKRLSFTPGLEEIAKTQNKTISADRLARVKQSLHVIATAPEEDQPDNTASSQRQEQGESDLNTKVKKVMAFSRLFKESRLALSLGVFLVFTCLPFITIKTIHDVCAVMQLSCKSWIPNDVLAGCMWIVLINSSINPGIYFFADLRYRQSLYNFLGVKQKCTL